MERTRSDSSPISATGAMVPSLPPTLPAAAAPGCASYAAPTPLRSRCARLRPIGLLNDRSTRGRQRIHRVRRALGQKSKATGGENASFVTGLQLQLAQIGRA